MADHPIRNSLAFAALFIAVAVIAKLAASLGLGARGDLSQRGLMALLGAFLVFTGNAMPKRLMPLSACDPARAQAIQRVAGWTWVLAGLALTLSWVALPLAAAGNATLVVVPAAMLISAGQMLRARPVSRSSN